MNECFKREKEHFKRILSEHVAQLKNHIATSNGDWRIRGFIDTLRRIYSLSSDTKVVSKILGIHIFPYMLEFARENGYKIELASQQNYYPDITFIKNEDQRIKFAVDFKTTFRKGENLCNGFTLGSHGEYFINRKSRKNIQYPYSEYIAHFCLGIIYERQNYGIDETKQYSLENLESIPAVASNFLFFVAEKWKIASDKGGSGNTANIGSIKNINDIMNEKGIFSEHGEDIFDDYWMNFGKITVQREDGRTQKITNLRDFLDYKKGG